jgi:hypothetical protein
MHTGAAAGSLIALQPIRLALALSQSLLAHPWVGAQRMCVAACGGAGVGLLDSAQQRGVGALACWGSGVRTPGLCCAHNLAVGQLVTPLVQQRWVQGTFGLAAIHVSGAAA